MRLLAHVSREQGRLLGKMEGLGFDLRSEAHLRTLTEDVVKTSEIEGERLEREQVRSSIARRLGMDIGGLVPADRNVDGVVEMTLDATRDSNEPLTVERLFAWHSALFPTGKWAKLAKCSQDTAYRDIADLVERGALRRDPGGGRSTSYSLDHGTRRN